MARPQSVKFVCSEDGCKKSAFYEAEDRNHNIELQKKYGNGKWKCIRHDRKDDLLSIERLKTSKDMVSTKGHHGMYFDNLFGFKAGPGYLAYADDFPEGTTLRITAEIILPD